VRLAKARIPSFSIFRESILVLASHITNNISILPLHNIGLQKTKRKKKLPTLLACYVLYKITFTLFFLLQVLFFAYYSDIYMLEMIKEWTPRFVVQKEHGEEG